MTCPSLALPTRLPVLRTLVDILLTVDVDVDA